MDRIEYDTSWAHIPTRRISLFFFTKRLAFEYCRKGNRIPKEKDLALRHGDNQAIRYAGWKGDACTIKDFYQKLCVNKGGLAI